MTNFSWALVSEFTKEKPRADSSFKTCSPFLLPEGIVAGFDPKKDGVED